VCDICRMLRCTVVFKHYEFTAVVLH